MKSEALKFSEQKSAFASAKAIKGSVQKIGLVCTLITKMKVDQALLQLQFCNKRSAKEISVLLNSAIANAENNHSLDVDNLYVSKILVGKSFNLKRFCPRARGRASKINKPFSRITIYVSEKE